LGGGGGGVGAGVFSAGKSGPVGSERLQSFGDGATGPAQEPTGIDRGGATKRGSGPGPIVTAGVAGGGDHFPVVLGPPGSLRIWALRGGWAGNLGGGFWLRGAAVGPHFGRGKFERAPGAGNGFTWRNSKGAWLGGYRGGKPVRGRVRPPVQKTLRAGGAGGHAQSRKHLVGCCAQGGGTNGGGGQASLDSSHQMVAGGG